MVFDILIGQKSIQFSPTQLKSLSISHQSRPSVLRCHQKTIDLDLDLEMMGLLKIGQGDIVVLISFLGLPKWICSVLHVEWFFLSTKRKRYTSSLTSTPDNSISSMCIGTFYWLYQAALPLSVVMQ